MIFINTMNPVTIAYHFFKKVQQKYNLREESLLTDTKNKKVNQLISFFEEIVSSHNLIIETEYALDLRGAVPPTYLHLLSVCRVRPQGFRVKISRGLDALWQSYKNFKN